MSYILHFFMTRNNVKLYSKPNNKDGFIINLTQTPKTTNSALILHTNGSTYACSHQN